MTERNKRYSKGNAPFEIWLTRGKGAQSNHDLTIAAIAWLGREPALEDRPMPRQRRMPVVQPAPDFVWPIPRNRPAAE